MVLTGGTYEGCSDDVLVGSTIMVELAVVDLDAVDSLPFFPGNIWLTRGVSRRVTH